MKKLYLLSISFLIMLLILSACGEEATPVPAGPNQSIVPPIATATTAPATPTEAATIAPTANPTTVASLPTITPPPDTVVVAPTETQPADTATPVPATTAPPTKAPTRTPTPVRATTAPPKPTATATSAPAKTNPPATNPPAQGLSEVVRGKTGKKEVAITLDAGAGSDPFPRLITALRKANVKVTFFLTGQWAQQNPTYVQQIVEEGHEIANHSWTHPDFTTISDQQIQNELNKTDDFLAKFTGESTKPLMRFPYGARNSHATQVVNSMGYRSIFWTLDSLDSVGQPKSAQFLIDRVTKQTDAQLDGSIILMHIGNATTAEAMPTILQKLQERGFKVVTISELLS
ncbi:MAG TPA: polysaccharide deacetylase family protein [Chloroflexia bacterium]|nr:polysaccharide deacetylase family protein [Chloroflexia bacterium]